MRTYKAGTPRAAGIFMGIAMVLASAGHTAVDHAATSSPVLSWCSIATQSTAAATALLDGASHHLNDPPGAIAHLHTEGTLPHQGIRDQSIAAEKDWPIMRHAAQAWRISGDPRYLQQVDTYLAAWATTYQADFNPIDETNLDGLIDAYTLTADALQPSTRAAVQALLRKLGNGYIERIQQAPRPASPTMLNNWQSHRVKLITMSAAALGDRAMLGRAFSLFKQQIADNIQADGSVVDFSERDALHYVVYDLQPLVQAALAAKPYGIGGDWLSYRTPQGGSLQLALNWLRPYADGQRTHQEFVHTKVPFDLARLKAGERGYSGLWDPKTSGTLYWLAAKLDGRYLATAQKLAAQAPDWIAICH
ncbi:alginate lyase family protein [Dyella silvatica]|uniref:alginate lyase family protein n=1 Tax=Dyella silvatica TaxID=2992128 RepID=UPI00224EEF50|nr:alginate lyase family protein [Dyella silvatica]